MISAKIQIDCLIRSNKIVLFVNSPKESKPLQPEIENENAQNQSDDQSSKNILQKLNRKIKMQNENEKLIESDMIQLLDSYEIAKEYISTVRLDQLKNYNECEFYLKKYYCNDQTIKVDAFLLNLLVVT